MMRQVVLIGLLVGVVIPVLSWAQSKHAQTASLLNFQSPEVKQMYADEKKGGTLFCNNSLTGRRVHFKNCGEFKLLNKEGCYGLSTSEINRESQYGDLCADLVNLKQATPAKVDYFDLSASDWWRPLPAAMLPPPGGIYSDSSWEKAQAENKRNFEGKQLGELKLTQVSVTATSFQAVLATHELECGKVEDFLSMQIVRVADFNGDGAADLLLKGGRVKRSTLCDLGSGNELGSGFSVLLQKPSAKAKISIISEK